MAFRHFSHHNLGKWGVRWAPDSSLDIAARRLVNWACARTGPRRREILGGYRGIWAWPARVLGLALLLRRGLVLSILLCQGACILVPHRRAPAQQHPRWLPPTFGRGEFGRWQNRYLFSSSPKRASRRQLCKNHISPQPGQFIPRLVILPVCVIPPFPRRRTSQMST